MRDLFSVIAGVLFVVGFAWYFPTVLRPDFRNAKASWMIWLSLRLISFVGMCINDVISGELLGAIIGLWIVFVVAMEWGNMGWHTIDKFCLSGAALAIILWLFFQSPLVGISISLAVIFIGFIPTFVLAWKEPGKESKVAWTLFLISNVLLVIPTFFFEPDLGQIVQIVTFCFIDVIMVYILYLRSGFLPQETAAAL